MKEVLYTLKETWNGYLFVLVVFAFFILLLFLSGMRKGLMKGVLAYIFKAIYWIVVIAMLALVTVVGFPLLFDGAFIPVILCFIMSIIALMLLQSVRTTKVAEAVNTLRMNNNEATKKMLSLINAENPEKIFVYEDGLVFCSFGTFIRFDERIKDVYNGDTSLQKDKNVKIQLLTIPSGMDSEPGVSRVIRYNQFGYKNMDDNAKRVFASVVCNETKKYSSSEIKHSHEEKRLDVDPGSPPSGRIDSMGNISIYGGSSSSYKIKEDTIVDGYTYILIRNDYVLAGNNGKKKEKKVKKETLKSW